MTTAPAPSMGVPAVKQTASGRVFNFSAGPGCLADEVLRQAQQDIWNIDATGVGILEHSHRGKTFDKVLADAEENCRKIAGIPANYKVLFLTGGATSQNFQVPANILPDNGVAAFLTTGYWAERTWEESKVYSNRCYEAFDGRPTKHTHCPADSEITYADRPVYVHMCSNNTLYGTQWRNADGSIRLPRVPEGVPLVCDMSSDMYSRPIDVTKFGIIYAGAQKNVGVAGTTVVIIREDLLKPVRTLPSMLRYDVMAKDQSRHNTPPVFAIYLSGLVFKWILAQGGLETIHRNNVAKAKVIYDVLDSTPFYKGHARPDCRSLMNLTFRCPTEALDDQFVKEAGKNGMDQLKGHRNTGGMRASIYNAFPMDGCRALAEFMRDFAKRNG
ncbi:MAG: 3-phosphoserine/phosphohydroxythreonine transaminase [Planctomycetota bacterium]|nr:3-phosphoserine/phosphohydroxythreonine transaminase [Planctomycetota bacterium]